MTTPPKLPLAWLTHAGVKSGGDESFGGGEPIGIAEAEKGRPETACVYALRVGLLSGLVSGPVAFASPVAASTAFAAAAARPLSLLLLAGGLGTGGMGDGAVTFVRYEYVGVEAGGGDGEDAAACAAEYAAAAEAAAAEAVVILLAAWKSDSLCRRLA